ncbi:alpha/beta fold hydrolase [Thalassiella azotivora]
MSATSDLRPATASRSASPPTGPTTAPPADRAPVHPVRLRTDDGVWLAAAVRGSRTPHTTVVLAHGWCLAGSSWDDVADRLAALPGVRVVTWDQRAHGRSGRPHRGAPPPSVPRLGDDLALVVSRLAPTGRLVLGGHSMGGMTVMSALDRHPALFDRLDGVLLAATTACTEGLGLPVLSRRLPEPTRRALVHAGLRFMARTPRLPAALTSRHLPSRLAALSPRVALGVRGSERLLFGRDADPAGVAAVHGLVARTSLSTLAGYYLHALAHHDERAVLPRLADVPTVVVTGARDRLVPAPHGEVLRTSIPDVRFVELPDAGHMVQVERPAEVAALFADLLTDLLADRVGGGDDRDDEGGATT